MNPVVPRISCICVVTRNGPHEPAALSFHEQLYPDKELVVLLVGGATWAWADENTQVVSCRSMPIGEATDLAIEIGTGDLSCLWPPDSFSSPLRLARQARHLADTPISATLIGEGIWGPGPVYVRDRRLAARTIMLRRRCFEAAGNRLFTQDRPLDTLSSQGEVRVLHEPGLFGFVADEPAPNPLTPEEAGFDPIDFWKRCGRRQNSA